MKHLLLILKKNKKILSKMQIFKFWYYKVPYLSKISIFIKKNIQKFSALNFIFIKKIKQIMFKFFLILVKIIRQ